MAEELPVSGCWIATVLGPGRPWLVQSPQLTGLRLWPGHCRGTRLLIAHNRYAPAAVFPRKEVDRHDSRMANGGGCSGGPRLGTRSQPDEPLR